MKRVTASESVVSASDLTDAIADLPPEQPFTDDLTQRWTRNESAAQERKEPWYTNPDGDWPDCGEQQRHWLGYITWTCERQEAKGREHPTARQFYQRVNNPQLLIYLAEASGLDETLVKRAADAALATSAAMPSMAKAIRELIPWEMVERALAPAHEERKAHENDPMSVSPALAALVGPGDKSKAEIIKRFWAYVKDHKLQVEGEEEPVLRVDSALRALVGPKDTVTLAEVVETVNKHIEVA